MIRERNGKLVVTAFYGRTDTGKRRSKSGTVGGTSRKHWAMARRLEDRLRADLERASASSPAGNDPTVAELLDAWLEVARLEASSRQSTESAIRVHLKPRLGAVRVSELTVSQLDRTYLEIEALPRKPATVVRIHGVLHAALETAVRWGIVDRNVASRARLPEVGRPDPHPPSLEDVGRLYVALQATYPMIATMVRVAAATGARRGELCGMRWNDVDLDAGIWRKRAAIKTAKGYTYIGETKTGNLYALSLDPGTVNLLRDLRTQMTTRAELFGMDLAPDAFVFSEAPDCSQWVVPGTITSRVAKVRADHELQHVTLKELRHFAATTMLASGVDPRTAAARLGHARTSTLTDIYAAFTAPADRAAATALGGLLDEVLNEGTGP